MMRPGRIARLAVTAVILAAAVFFAVRFFFGGESGTKLTAYFSRSVGLYVGDDVRVLGIKVGEIDSVTPQPNSVRVTFTVDPGIDIPAGAKAAIVAPNVVTGRFVQLVPAYTKGPTLPSGAVIPLSRTAVPVEWDEIKAQLTRLATALGPQGANRNGAVGDALGTVDANLTGSAAELHTMLHDLSSASTTLANSRGDLFATVRNLQVFIAALNRSDSAVRSFSGQLTGLSGLLVQNKSNLAVALRELDSAMTSVSSFLRNNRGALKHGVSSLATVAHNLNAKQYQLQLLLHVAPTALSNFYNIIDPRYHAATGTLAIGNFDDVAQLVCRQIIQTGGVVADCIKILQPLVKQIGLVQLPLSIRKHVARTAAAATKQRSAQQQKAPPISKTQQNLVGLLLPGGGS
jgi:phospholipid/cholesterol/gamma-HCH transport system substrate-binding protein